MFGKRKFSKVIWIVIFIFIVGITGYVLSSTGNMRNPFSAFSALSQTNGQGLQGDRGPEVAGETNRRPPDAAGNGEGGSGQASLAWSQIGGVLFNVWFLFATANVVIVVQPVMGYVKHRLRPRKHRVALGLA